MAIEVDIQIMPLEGTPAVPTKTLITQWVELALSTVSEAELSIRIVGLAEITDLNQTYRHKNQPTNVLSFPFDVPDIVTDCHLLGDIVICAEIVALEAAAQNKTWDSHWAHMVVHGVLHLLGYDHQTDEQAEVMEALEVTMLSTLGYPNPYAEVAP